MAPPKFPSLAPENIRAVVTTKWKNGYRPVALSNIESYRVDSQLDNDSDAFSITFGDPTNQLRASLNRDNEVRIQLFGLGKNISYLHTGIVDDLEYDEENRLVMTGRDLSSIAADTDADPGVWRKMRATDFIKMRADDLKMGQSGVRYALTKTQVQPKISTDGSETEWELWYRLIRNQSHWIWFTPDAVLTSGPLNYEGAPTYFFGTPKATDSGNNRTKWIPVERISYRKTTQGRVGKVVLWYKHGNPSQIEELSDPTTNEWLKRPLKFFESSKVHTPKGARKNLLEEIFETKVGALEIRITIPDVGTLIRQNSVARLRIPELDIENDWFVVGSTIIADEEGFTQEVRLREKGYAISKRFPSEPAPADKTPIDECEGLNGLLPANPDWIYCFLTSSNQPRLALDSDFFAAVLIAICEHETHFHNIRSHNSGELKPGCTVRTYGPGPHVEYFPLPLSALEWPPGVIRDVPTWFTAFANKCGDDYVTGEYAVGPMQLFYPSVKEAADRIDGPVNEWHGGRWNPCTNIEQGARHLFGYVTSCGVNVPKHEDGIWAAVNAYGTGTCDADGSYAREIRNGTRDTTGVMGDDGWYARLKNARAGCAEQDKKDQVAGSCPGAVIPVGAASLGDQYRTHITTGLSNYGAVDMFGTADGIAVAPEKLRVTDATSTSTPGYAFYADGLETKMKYWFGHLNNVGRPKQGATIERGGRIGTLWANTPGGAHLHVGVDARPAGFVWQGCEDYKTGGCGYGTLCEQLKAAAS
jgi:hypothetical protein